MEIGLRKPAGTGEKEQLKLDSAASHMLEECRMVLPGVQALFGFQLMAVFANGFDQKLGSGEQYMHFAAMFLVAVAAALAMTPAAVHRQSEPTAVTERFVWLSSLLLLLAMIALALGLALDVYLIGRAIFQATVLSVVFAALLLGICAGLWLGLPRSERRKTRSG
jgi:hypothetical protein